MNSRLATFLVLILACTSCRKSDDKAPSGNLPANTWTYGSTTLQPAYSETNTRSGYQLVFYPAGTQALTTSISFLFKARPQSGNTYSAAKDTSAANLVRISLKTGAGPGYVSAGSNAPVNAAVTDGKLQLTGNEVKMVRDTISAPSDTVTLNFNLTEF